MLSRNITVRTALESDLDGVRALIAGNVDGAVVTTTKPERFDAMIASGEYRPEWIRVADDDGRLVAAAVFWGFAARRSTRWRSTRWSPQPDVDDAGDDLGRPHPVRGRRPAGCRADGVPHLPARNLARRPGDRDARSRPGSPPPPMPASPTSWNASGTSGPPTWASRTGRRGWSCGRNPTTPRGCGCSPRSPTARLDATTKDEVRRLGVVGYAEAELSMYASMPGDRSWWRFAYDKAGDLVGFAMPSRNNGGPVVGYLGVLPGASRPRLRRRSPRRDHRRPRRLRRASGSSPTPTRRTCRWRPRSTGPATTGSASAWSRAPVRRLKFYVVS